MREKTLTETYLKFKDATLAYNAFCERPESSMSWLNSKLQWEYRIKKLAYELTQWGKHDLIRVVVIRNIDQGPKLLLQSPQQLEVFYPYLKDDELKLLLEFDFPQGYEIISQEPVNTRTSKKIFPSI